ncbi:hypothetical protein VTO42DRAFT_5324 [Malbranchea cinnamomea]
MAAVVNRDVAAPSPVSPGKRKRDSTSSMEPPTSINGSQVDKQNRLIESLQDLLKVMLKYDSGLGLLRQPLPDRPALEPNTKRPKLSQAVNGVETIESRILSHEYTSLQEFLDDVEAATELIIGQTRQSQSLANGLHNRETSPADLANRTRHFKAQLNDLLRRHPFTDLPLGNTGFCYQQTQGDENAFHNVPREDKIVLTVQANIGRGRQLFSSLQKSNRQNHSLDDAAVASFDEASLPNGVSISRVLPFNPANLEEMKTRTRTIGEVFAPHSSLPILEPPRKTDISASRPAVVEWLSPVDAIAAEASALGDQRYYSSSSAPMIHWVNYGYELPDLPGRRKTYQGNMVVESQQSETSQRISTIGKAKFFEAFSSFAPSFDSSGSVVPRNTKTQAWWRKSGLKHFQRMLYPENSTEIETITAQLPQINLDQEALENAVESFDPEPLELTKTDDKEGDSEGRDRDLEDVIQDISELLRTLDSYRRLRQLGPGASIVHETDNSANMDTRANPSAAELEVYETLKSSLSAMIATLPPYAVAKLNGEQLSELNISKKIVLDSVDYPGTMEEDEYTLHQRQAPKVGQMIGTARSATGASRTPPATTYQRYSSRAKPPPSNFQNPQSYGNRTSSVHYQPNGPPQHPTPLQPASNHPGYVQQPQYSQPGTPQQTRVGILQQFQRTSQNSSPHLTQRGHSPAQSLSHQYQPRPAPPNYQHPQAYHSPVPGPRSASPQKAGAYGHSPQRQYLSPTPSQSQPRYFQQQPHLPQPIPQQGPQPASFPNFPSNQASPVAPPYSSTAAAAMVYSRSAAEQAALMERNRAQLGEVQRPSSATPQPPQHSLPNGQPKAHGQPTQESKPGVSATASSTA